MLSHYFIALGSLPQRLPQQKAAGAKKSMLLGPIHPHPRLNRGKYRYLDGPCSGVTTASLMMAANAILDRGYGKPTQSMPASPRIRTAIT